MATTITSTIGTGGDYASLAEWFTAAPASLVTADQIWRGELLNQEFTSTGNLLNLTGKTADATRYFELTTAAGCSFLDHATYATNPLRYDATKGAAVRLTSNFATGVIIAIAYTRVSKIQFSSSSTLSSVSSALSVSVATTGLCDVNQCIIDGNTDSTTQGAANFSGPSNTLRNSVVIQRRASATSLILSLRSGSRSYNNTLVSIGATLNAGIATQYEAATIKNTYIGGVAAATNGVSAPTVTTSYCNATSTNFSVTPFDTTNFENVTSATLDLRLKSDSTLVGAGSAEATYGATDILNTARPVNGTWDVGAYEYPGVTDSTAPTLSTPTGTQTGSTTSSGTVSTNESGGTLFWLTNTASSATQGDVLASATSQAVSSAGTQNVTSTGLTASTVYYNHFVHRDAALNSSAVASSASFTTTAGGGDVTAPTLSSPTATQTGSTTASGTVTTNEANGTLYRYVSTNATETAATVKASGQTTTVTATGVQTVSFTGLPANTLQYAHYVHRDAAGNDSTVSNSASFTTPVATGSFTTNTLGNNTSTGWPQGTSVYWQWHQGGRVGTAATTITYGTGTLNSDKKLVATGCPLGAGFILVAVRGAALADDQPYYETGTVA